MNDWIAYHIAPIDFGWGLLLRVEEFAARVKGHEEAAYTSSQLRLDLDKAKELARAVGWEGDFRKGYEPRVLMLPDEVEMKYAFVWKQENNGSTFVVSPIELPWLDGVVMDGLMRGGDATCEGPKRDLILKTWRRRSG